MPFSGSRFSKGMKDGLPIALGYLSVSFAFGMISVKNGLPFWVPISISLTNYTGTGQFAGMELMAGPTLLVGNFFSNGLPYSSSTCAIFSCRCPGLSGLPRIFPLANAA